MVRIKNNSYMHEITCVVAFFSLFKLFWHLLVKLGFSDMKHNTQHYMVRIEKLDMYFKLRAKLRFFLFLIFFGTYLLKLVQIWFA